MSFCTNCGAQIAEGASSAQIAALQAPDLRAAEKPFMTVMYISVQTVEKPSLPLLRSVLPADMK